MSQTNWSDMVGDVGSNQYDERIQFLKNTNRHTASIESTVSEAMISLESSDSFVIFGEPQSGKTEMMIALNARLLDAGHPTIVNLLTDSIDLLDQSLRRFRKSGISPSPKNFDEVDEDQLRSSKQQLVVFCKKNARNLEELAKKLRFRKERLVIDDEADFASPDGNVNRPDHEKTKINGLISDLISEGGRYIGVTATPARLNLNDTFSNESEHWVKFEPHPNYVGQDFFFPQDGRCDYRLNLFDAEEGSEKVQITNAILNFLCGVAELHLTGRKPENFTMLIHTSGKNYEQEEDLSIIKGFLHKFTDGNPSNFASLKRKLWEVAERYCHEELGITPDVVGEFVLRNIQRNSLVEINSKNPKPGKVAEIADPTSLFSFGVGGNIISRGVTFNNLLSLYFTRTVKGKFTQDTYIQRARMFGSRNDYKDLFQLWIPEQLMQNWNRCFAFHKLAVQTINAGAGAPVWMANHKTSPTSNSSINRTSVDFESGVMSFGMFEFRNKITQAFERNGRSDEVILRAIFEELGELGFPEHVLNYILLDCNTYGGTCSFHKPSEFGSKSSTYGDDEIANIRRSKGIFATHEYNRSERPDARNHLKIFFNSHGKARLFFRVKDSSTRFIRRNQ